MDIQILDHFPLSIKAQLKRQIIAMINDRRLEPGQPLLSAKQMGLFLNINRNTVAAAYKELESQGYVRVIKGSGTYVGDLPDLPDFSALKATLSQAIAKAQKLGFDNHTIVDECITCLLEIHLNKKMPKKVILVDCNYEILQTLDEKLKKSIPVDTHMMLIQDITAWPEKFKKRARGNDRVLCGMNHMKELTSAVFPLQVPVTGFMIRTDFQIMDQILQLPAGTKVGYCCLTQKSSQAFFTSSLFSSDTELIRYHAGIGDTSKVESMLADCRVVFATHFIYDHLSRQFPDARNIRRVDLDIDPENFQYILSCLGKKNVGDGRLS